MTPTAKFSIYQDKEQWIPFFNWFWQTTPGAAPHGAYPARWIAWLSGWWHTR